MFFYLTLVVLISFLIVDSIISYYIVKDIEDYKGEYFNNFNKEMARLYDQIARIRFTLEEHSRRIHKPKTKKSAKKNEETERKNPKS